MFAHSSQPASDLESPSPRAEKVRELRRQGNVSTACWRVSGFMALTAKTGDGLFHLLGFAQTRARPTKPEHDLKMPADYGARLIASGGPPLSWRLSAAGKTIFISACLRAT
jgi:hypothetical protein